MYSDRNEGDARGSGDGRGQAHSLRPGTGTKWGPLDALGAYLVALTSSVVAVSIVLAAGSSEEGRVAVISGILGLWVGFIGGPLVASYARGTGRPLEEFRVRFELSDLPLGMLTGVVCQLLVVPALTWPLQELLGGDVSAPARDLLGPAGPGRWLTILLVVAGAPIAEELFFRGLLLRGLARHMADRSAVVVSSAIFAATHFQLLPLPGLFAAGLLFASLTLRWGRLGPAVVAHAAFNATTVVALLL